MYTYMYKRVLEKNTNNNTEWNAHLGITGFA